MAKPYNALEGERPTLSFKLRGDSSEEKVSIIVVHKDRPEYLNILLQTITVTSVHNNYEIIVVDNGSGQRSQDFLDDLEEDGVKIVRNPENVWWSKAANQGIKAASKDSKYFILMHHDMNIVNPSWLDLMINVAEQAKSGLLGLGLKQYDMDGEKSAFIDESCMLVSRECWNDCGPFCEDLQQEGSPFLFCFIANRKGYNPQAIDQRQTPCAFHYKVFAMDFSEFERHVEKSQMLLPKLIQSAQSS